MAKDTTPARWPVEQRGLLDDLAEIIGRLFLLALGSRKRKEGLATDCGWATRKA
jgi:hypothetical protein